MKRGKEEITQSWFTDDSDCLYRKSQIINKKKKTPENNKQLIARL